MVVVMAVAVPAAMLVIAMIMAAVVVPAVVMTAVIVAAVVLTLRRGLQAADVLVGARSSSRSRPWRVRCRIARSTASTRFDHGACFRPRWGRNVQRGHRAPGGELPHVNVADGRQAGTAPIRPCSTFSGEASSGAPSSRMWIDLASSFHALRRSAPRPGPTGWDRSASSP